MIAHDADRLTDEDRRRITVAMTRTVACWRASPSSFKPRLADCTTLERVGATAIACSVDDLRPVESEWLLDAAPVCPRLAPGAAGAAP